MLIFNMVWPWFSRETVCVCLQFPYRRNVMIFLDFSYCPLSRVLHVTCTLPIEALEFFRK